MHIQVREKQASNQGTNSSPHLQSEKASLLARSDIFGHLQPADLRELERLATIVTCPPGRIFYRPGEKATTLFLLNTGKVQLYHLSTDGRKLIMATLGAGNSFGELPLLGQTPHTNFAEAVEHSQLCTIGRQDAEKLLTQKPEVMLDLLKVTTQRFTQLEAQLINAAFKNTPSRLAALLLQLAHPQGDLLVVKGLSHEELAERLGIYRETVSAALRELKDAGTITSGRKYITISQPARLKDIAAL